MKRKKERDSQNEKEKNRPFDEVRALLVLESWKFR